MDKMPMPPPVQCPSCHGKGVVRVQGDDTGKFVACMQCGGNGHIYRRYWL